MTELELLNEINTNILATKELLGFLVALIIFFSFIKAFKYVMSFLSFFLKGV